MNGNDTFLDVNNAHLRVTNGNVYASAFNLDQIDIVMSSNTASTVNFNNPTKAFNAASNIEVGTANLFVDTTTTRVGVGTASPATTLDVAGDLNVSGNLTIIGTTTTLDTDHLRVQDPIIELGKDNTASPVVDLGLVMTRPAGTSNVGIIFDESADTLEIGYTQGNASDSTITMDSAPLSVNVNGDLSVTSNVEVGTANLFVDTVNSRVGVGTTNPAYSFDVQTTSDASDKTMTRLYSAANATGVSSTGIILEKGAGYGGVIKGFISQGIGSGLSLHTLNGGTEAQAMTIMNSGNVGIGTDNPLERLHIRGDNCRFVIADSSENDADTNAFNCGIAFVDNTYDGTKTYAGNPAAGMGFFIGHYSSASKEVNMVNLTGPLSFGTRNNNRAMYISDNGNVGIGTTSPVAKLHVHYDTAQANWRDFYVRPTSLWGDGLTTASETLGTKYMTVNAIMLQAPHITPSSTGQNAYIRYGRAGGIASGVWWETACVTDGSFRIRREAVDAYGMTITSAGDVGIGTTSPSYKLHVNGSLFYSSGGLNGSDDRIKYNEENVSNALTLISQLNPQKYEKIMEIPQNTEGEWIPTDEEWENVKEDYKYGDEFGFIAQDVRNIPELSFLVNGDETRTDMKTSTPEEYSNLTTDEQGTYTVSYIHESNTITQAEYSNLTLEEQETCVTQYTKQIETQTPLALNYQGLFVVAIGAIKELKTKNDALEARILALESAS